MAENQRMVETLVGRPDLSGKPILFLLNKKDLPEPIDEMQFSDKFELHNMAKINKADIRVEGICAVKGTGKEMDHVIGEGIEWLIEKIQDNFVNIEKGVTAALKNLQDRQAQDRLERQHRLAAIAASKTEEEGTQENEDTKEQGIPNGIAKITNIEQVAFTKDAHENLANTSEIPTTSNIDYSVFEIKTSDENPHAFTNPTFEPEITENDKQIPSTSHHINPLLMDEKLTTVEDENVTVRNASLDNLSVKDHPTKILQKDLEFDENKEKIN